MCENVCCPDAISVKRNGFALWLTRGLFSEHLLRDEDVKHCVPRPHHDYFYSSVKFYVPADKVCDVLKISGSCFMMVEKIFNSQMWWYWCKLCNIVFGNDGCRRKA